MADLAAAFKIVATHSGQALTQLAGLVCQSWQPLPGAQADCAFLAREGEEAFVVYMEAFDRWDGRALWRILARSSALSEHQRMPTLCLLYILFPAGYHDQSGQFRLRIGATATQALWFREICLWQLAPEPWWEMFPGMMALFPLSRHGHSPEQAVAFAAERIHRHEKDPKKRADLLTILALLAKRKDADLDVLNLIGNERMKDSPLYQEILTEGGVLQCRADILQVLQLRFGDREAKQCKKPLNLIEDLDSLKDLLREAVASRRFEQFRRGLESR